MKITNRLKKYKTGLLVGRFQPFHKGHLKLIKESFKHINKMVIGVGSVNATDENNFLSYEQRKRILEEIISQEKLENNIIKIVPLKDFFNDKLWLEHCLKAAGKFEAVIGNNEWTNGIFEKAGFKVLRLGFYKRYLYEGVKIRKLIKFGKPWTDRVPKYIVNLLLS